MKSHLPPCITPSVLLEHQIFILWQISLLILNLSFISICGRIRHQKIQIRPTQSPITKNFRDSTKRIHTKLNCYNGHTTIKFAHFEIQPYLNYPQTTPITIKWLHHTLNIKIYLLSFLYHYEILESCYILNKIQIFKDSWLLLSQLKIEHLIICNMGLIAKHMWTCHMTRN